MYPFEVAGYGLHTHTSLLEEMRATAAPLVRRYVDSKGKTRFTGVKKKLKNSQPGPERLHIWYTHTSIANIVFVSKFLLTL